MRGPVAYPFCMACFKPISLRLLEPLLWDVAHAACLELELSLSAHKKQQVAFVLDAPNADEARKAFLEAHPEVAERRKQVLARLPGEDLFAAPEKLDTNKNRATPGAT